MSQILFLFLFYFFNYFKLWKTLFTGCVWSEMWYCLFWIFSLKYCTSLAFVSISSLRHLKGSKIWKLIIYTKSSKTNGLGQSVDNFEFDSEVWVQHCHYNLVLICFGPSQLNSTKFNFMDTAKLWTNKPVKPRLLVLKEGDMSYLTGSL